MEAAGAAAHPPGGAAQDTGPPLRPPGCCAPPAAAALRAGLDPGDRCGPSAAATTGQARACPRPRTAPAATCRPRMVGTARVIYRQCCNDPLSPGCFSDMAGTSTPYEGGGPDAEGVCHGSQQPVEGAGVPAEPGSLRLGQAAEGDDVGRAAPGPEHTGAVMAV